MSSKAIREKKDDGRPAYHWTTPAELSPSLTRDAEPTGPRLFGAVGLALVVFGGVALLVHLSGRTSSWVGPTWGGLATLAGLGGLLLHAAGDSDLQIRRAYMSFAYLVLALGALLSVVPYKGPAFGLFLPYGLCLLLVGLLFQMAFVRNEVEAKTRDYALYALGGVGALLALAGFVGGNISTSFLLPNGLLMVAAGFVFLWAFVGLKGVTDDTGYYAALGVGALGALAALLALARSMPHILSQTDAFARRGWLAGSAPYLMPNGLVLLGGGLAYLALALFMTSERPFVIMTRRQLGAYFYSPIAYFMLLLFALVACLYFGQFVGDRLLDPMTNRPKTGVPEPIILSYFFSLIPIFCLVFVVPVLTMNLLSEENRSGTLEMTLTAPQEETTIVLSKFAAALFLFMMTWVPWGLFLVALRVGGGNPFDYQPFLAWLIVLLFTGAGFVSMGVFFSSLTKNQLTAAVFTFVGMLLLVVLFLAKQQMTSQDALWYKVFSRVSFLDLWLEALDGKLAVSQLFYHLSVTVFWLFLSVKVLESRKWR